MPGQRPSKRMQPSERVPSLNENACCWPYCSRVTTYGSGRGGRVYFCGPSHRAQYRAERSRLLADVAALAAADERGERGSERRSSQRSLLLWHLARFPELPTSRPKS
jgi:hypothetical protein